MVNYVGDASGNFFVGTAFKDTLDGQGGNDTLHGQGSNDYILGGTGNDQLGGAVGKDTIFGGLDQDNIDGGADTDPDQLFGEDGNDIMFGRVKDLLDGGGGNDHFQLNLTSVSTGVNVDLSGLTAGGAATILNISVSDFETGFIFFTTGDDKVKAASMAVQLHGSQGNDTLLGGTLGDQMNGGTDLVGDDDVLRGGDGADGLVGGVGDLLDGGLGSDVFTLQMTASTDDFTVNFAPLYTGGMVFVGMGTRVVRCESGTIQLGSGDDEVKTGSLTGQSGVIVTSGAGNDTLIGGDGHDNLAAQGGDDVIRGGDGIDTANYQYESAAVTIDLNITGFQDTGGAGMDKISECERVNGGGGDDRIVGNAADNTFEGYGGADTLIGGLGNDMLNGGSGGFDPLTDTDRLSGGAGQDTYSGGNGNDVLVWSSTFHTTVAAPDQIPGLETGDVLHLKDIDADTTTGGDQAFTVVGVLTGAAGQLAVAYDGIKTRFLMDTDGDGTANGLIEAAGDHTGHTEFVL